VLRHIGFENGTFTSRPSANVLEIVCGVNETAP